MGSHQLLAREEKCESSFAETEDVEWRRVDALRKVVRMRVVGRRGGIFAICISVSFGSDH